MKKLLLLTFVVILNGTISSQLWEKLNFPSITDANSFIDLKVVDENVVWALATNYNNIASSSIPIVLVTWDGGKTWKKHLLSIAANRVAYDIYAFDSLTAIITSNRLVSSDTRPIFKTIDGGNSWISITPPEKSGGVFIHFFDDMNGLALNSGFLSLSNDSGDTWQLQPELPIFSNEYFGFWNGSTNKYYAIDNHFWIGSSAGRIFKSKDKGKTWHIYQAAKTNESIEKLIFTDTLNGYALVTGTVQELYDQSIMYITSNGGETWKRMEDQDFNFHNMGINPSNNVIYVSEEFDPGPFRKNNNYFNKEGWEFCLEELVSVFGIEFYNNIGYAIGRDENDKNIILKINDLSNALTEMSTESSNIIYPNPTTGYFRINGDRTFKFLKIIDNAGRILLEDEFHNSEYDISNLSSGYYHITVIGDDYYENFKLFKN